MPTGRGLRMEMYGCADVWVCKCLTLTNVFHHRYIPFPLGDLAVIQFRLLAVLGVGEE